MNDNDSFAREKMLVAGLETMVKQAHPDNPAFVLFVSDADGWHRYQKDMSAQEMALIAAWCMKRAMGEI